MDKILPIKTTTKNFPQSSKLEVISKSGWFILGGNILKWTGIIILTIFLLTGMYIAFGFYIYGSFVLSLLIGSSLFYSVVTVPGELYFECDMTIDEENKIKYRTIGLYKIPDDIIKTYTVSGDNQVKFKTSGGKTINVVDSINFKKKIITYSWIASLSNIEFYLKEETFHKLKEEFKKVNRDIIKTKETRELYNQIEFIKMLDDMEKGTEADEVIKTIQEKIDQILRTEVENDKQ